MNNVLKKLTILTLTFGFFIFTSPVITLAQSLEGSGFSISPPSFDLNANPGDVIKNSIKVINVSAKDLNIKVRAENFIAYGEGGQVALTEEESTYSISKWLEFKNTEFIVKPGETHLFEFTLNIPTNAEPGSHYGSVVFSTAPSNSLTGSGASILQEIGAIILIRIPGNVTESATLTSFNPSQQTYTEPKVQLTALVENTGSVHFKPYGFIHIRDLFGNKVQTIEVKGRNILPGSKRLFDETFDFEYIGLFKAELELFYKDGQEVIRGETSFVALNQSKSVPIALGSVAAIAFYIIFRKRINKAIKVVVKG